MDILKNFIVTCLFLATYLNFFLLLLLLFKIHNLLLAVLVQAVGEYVIAQKNTILIPISQSSGEHQKINAFSLLQNGIFHIIEERYLTPNILAEAVIEQIENPFLQKYTENISSYPTILNSSKKISQFISTFLEGKYSCTEV